MTLGWRVVFLIVTLAGWGGTSRAAEPERSCSEAWYRSIEQRLSTGDGHGHGSDLGSDEWKSVVGFKLGVRGAADVPSGDSDAWCRYVERLVREGRPLSPATGPSYSCEKVAPGSVEGMVCKDAALSKLDRKLADVYAASSKKATNEHPPVLKAEQRGWVKGRDECGKSDDERRCVENAYERRIAELQARYCLVPATGPVWFSCDGNSANEVVVTFFQTDPPSLIAERGDSVSLMCLQQSGSGSKYQGRNETFWEHGGEALVTWGYGAPQMHCTKRR